MRFKSLKWLSLSDPLYKPTPITILANYRSYVIYSLSHIQTLDGILITAEEKSAVTVSYLLAVTLFLYDSLLTTGMYTYLCTHKHIYAYLLSKVSVCFVFQKRHLDFSSYPFLDLLLLCCLYIFNTSVVSTIINFRLGCHTSIIKCFVKSVVHLKAMCICTNKRTGL